MLQANESVETNDHVNTETEAGVAIQVESVPEDKPLLIQDKDINSTQKVATTAPTKVLFLDGVRGLAAVMVISQHSHEYMVELKLGAIAVDMFFVLSSFLLTWLFMKKSIRLLAQKATVRTWVFTLADYFSKRFWRVYPLFALTSICIWSLSSDDKAQYYLIKKPEEFDLYKVLTFDFDHRYFVFWTLPLEITYYFFIPVFVLGVLLLRRFWWVPFIPAYYWVIEEGWNKTRMNHMGLRPHLPTFVAGSMAAVVFVKLEAWIKTSGFQFCKIHVIPIRVVEYTSIALLFSVTFHGLFFDWVYENPTPYGQEFFFVSVLLTTVFVVEMLLPSCVSGIFEWSVLRYWGKIGFSVYLLHGFVLYADAVQSQPNWYDRLFSRYALVLLLATVSYHLVEYPSQLLSQRITKALAEQEKNGCGGLSTLLGGWSSPKLALAQQLKWAQEAKSTGVVKAMMKIRSKSMEHAAIA